MRNRSRRRRSAVAMIAILACTLTLMGTALFALAAPVSPTQNFKDQLKAGCDAAGGSFVEDANTNTFRCNLKGGGAIVCPEGGGQCWYEPLRALQGILGTKIGGVKEQPVSTGSTPTPTPTNTRPGGSVLGGIVATVGPAKLPPETGFISGQAWTCPSNLSNDYNTLSTHCIPTSSIGYAVFGASLAQQFPMGQFTYSGLAPGNYTIRELVPNGYGVDLTTYCSVASNPQYPSPSTFHRVVVYQGYYEFMLAAGQFVYCNSFNSPPSTATPTHGVKGVTGGVLTNPQAAQGNAAPSATSAPGTPAP